MLFGAADAVIEQEPGDIPITLLADTLQIDGVLVFQLNDMLAGVLVYVGSCTLLVPMTSVKPNVMLCVTLG